MGASVGHHLLPYTEGLALFCNEQNNYNFSESKQIYWSMATANTSWQEIFNWFTDIFRVQNA